MENICRAIAALSEAYPDVHFVYPVHLSPYVRETAEKFLGGNDRVHLIHPLAVDEMHNLMARCYLIMTDSEACRKRPPVLASRCWCCAARNRAARGYRGRHSQAGWGGAGEHRPSGARAAGRPRRLMEQWRMRSTHMATARPLNASYRRLSIISACGKAGPAPFTP